MMIKKNLFFIAFLILTSSYCQEFIKPSEGKSLVYFVRHSGVGSLINFKYFDGEKYLGKINGANYFTYECEPGDHVFWAASENRDFLKGTLKANETYVIEVKPKMGAFKAAVRLHPVSPDNDRVLKRIKRILLKRKPIKLKRKDEDLSFFIKKGIERYQKIKSKVEIINTNWIF